MRIQSQFKEYYDSQQKYNTDHKRVFSRNLIVDIAPPIPEYRADGLSLARIGFCGTVYNCLYRQEYVPHEAPDSIKYKYNYRSEEFIYHLDDYIQMVNKKVTTEDKRVISNHLSSCKDDSLFIKYNCPVFIHIKDMIFAHTMSRPFIHPKCVYYAYTEKNRLTDYQFDKMMPAPQAYMSIESYISGVLTREYKDVPEMDNATKVASHGFNRCSFRK